MILGGFGSDVSTIGVDNGTLCPKIPLLEASLRHSHVSWNFICAPWWHYSNDFFYCGFSELTIVCKLLKGKKVTSFLVLWFT